MAGFLFNLGDNRKTGESKEQALVRCIENGAYLARNVGLTKTGRWSTESLALMADFLSMKQGDHVYFLCSRNIYGVGGITSLGGLSCALGNFPNACEPHVPPYKAVRHSLLFDDGSSGSVGNRWVCLFEPSPRFFTTGVDMDDALSARPESMRRLPANEGRTFLKLDDEEDRVLSQLIFLANRNESCSSPCGPLNANLASYKESHSRLSKHLSSRPYRLDPQAFLMKHREGRRLTPEMALEATLVYRLQMGSAAEAEIFGRFDYVAHQVPASPMKPFKWMDKMDVFGYEYAARDELGDIDAPVVRYAIVEIKPGVAKPADVSQVMSYVDWVTSNWAGHDPFLVNAFLVAASFPPEVIAAAREFGIRHRTTGRREDSRTETWSRMALVSYACDRTQEQLTFSLEKTFSKPSG